jgi:hypothetical protein
VASGAATGRPELARRKAAELDLFLQEQIDARKGRPPVGILGELVELDGEPRRGGGTNQHGLRSLPVRFAPRPT